MQATASRPVSALSLVACVALGLSACGGEKSSGGAQAAPAGSTAAAQAPAAAAPAAAPAAAMGAPDGKQVFQRCAVCHQATGLGVPAVYPPLAGSEWANAANAALPIRVVLHGLQGSISVKGKTFNGSMPAYGTGQPLNDAEVAAVLTYVRSTWGNTSGAVTADEVAKVRAATASRTTQWSAAELRPLLGGSH